MQVEKAPLQKVNQEPKPAEDDVAPPPEQFDYDEERQPMAREGK